MTTRTCHVLGVACLALLPAATAAGGDAESAGGVDVAAVEKAWADRQAKVKSFRVEWTDSVTLPKGRVSRNRPAGGSELSGEVPPADLVFDAPKSLAVDGPKARFQYQTRHWSVAKGVAYTETCDTAFDGTEYKTAATYDPPVVTNNGGVKRARNHPDLGVLSCRPAVLALRGTSPQYRVYDVSAYRPTGRTVEANGVRCAELSRMNTAGTGGLVLLVDPARDYVPVRAAGHDNGQLGYQLDVTYRPDPVAGWVPAAWEYASYDAGGKLNTAGRCVATRWEINPALSDADLSVSPPAGTLMVDATAKPQTKYVVRPDGQPGKRVPFAANVTYAQLVAANEGSRWWTGPWLLVTAVFAGSAGLLGWRVVARRRGSAAPPAKA